MITYEVITVLCYRRTCDIDPINYISIKCELYVARVTHVVIVLNAQDNNNNNKIYTAGS